jgi:hypothetical protein
MGTVTQRQCALPLGFGRHLCFLVSTGPKRTGNRFVRQWSVAMKVTAPAGSTRTISLAVHFG